MIELGMAELLTGGGGLVLVIWALIQLINKLLDRKKDTGSDDPSHCKASETDAVYQKQVYKWAENNNKLIASMYDIIQKTDDNGVHLVYVPRSFEQVQKETVTLLNSMVASQEKTAYILDKLYNQLHQRSD